MERRTIECLLCGCVRTVEKRDTEDCPRCGYVGWAPAETASKRVRNVLRESSLARRLGVVA
ncbi:MAG TPA: hypothetical protein VH538_00990 [Gaiellaceae bacterium]|jgi:hypothetical protein